MSAETPFFAWWNLQNFFAPNPVDRIEEFPLRVRASIRKQFGNWDDDAVENKTQHLADVIVRMNGGQGPDFLGVCELEKKSVLERLVQAIEDRGGRRYSIIHRESKDLRGIDVAFLYDTYVLAQVGRPVNHSIVKRYPTRDIFETRIRLRRGPFIHQQVVVLGNHWPSRRGGQYTTEPFRIMVAETASVLVEQMLLNNEDEKILIMGDFNDEPHNRSIQEYLLALRDKEVVTREKPANVDNRYSYGSRPFPPTLYNPTWNLLTRTDPGTHYYHGRWNMLDQVIVSRALVEAPGLRLDENSLKIHLDTSENLIGGTMKRNHNRGSVRGFQRNNHGFYEGYSDHLPLTFTLH